MQKRHAGTGNIVEHTLHIITHMNPANGQGNPVRSRPFAHPLKRQMGHGEHAGDADQVGGKILYLRIEKPAPGRVVIKLIRPARVVATFENFMVEVTDLYFHTDFAQVARQNDQSVRGIVSVAAPLGGVVLEQLGMRIRRIDQ